MGRVSSAGRRPARSRDGLPKGAPSHTDPQDRRIVPGLPARARAGFGGADGGPREPRATSKAFRAELADWMAERRAAIKAMPFTADGRRAAYAELKRTRASAAERERARLAEARKDSAAHPLPTWQEWLQTQASQGNALAAEVLRSTSQRQAEFGAAVLSAANAEQARHVVYQHLRPAVGRDGAITYRVADGGRVTDQAKQVRVDEVSVAATFLALSLASDRFGDRALAVKGTDDFKRQVAQLAAVEGMNVTFADPDMEAERQRALVATRARQAQQSARPAPAPEPVNRTPEPCRGESWPEVAAFVAERNAAPDGGRHRTAPRMGADRCRRRHLWRTPAARGRNRGGAPASGGRDTGEGCLTRPGRQGFDLARRGRRSNRRSGPVP